ncbi:MAG: DoxX family protein, partial [Acidobacteriota bacterium]
VLGGALLLFPPLRHWAAWGLVLLLLAVYPANLHVAFNHHLYPEIPLLFHWIRLPLQFLLIAWAWWFTRRK